jgi:hypothetical protein
MIRCSRGEKVTQVGWDVLSLLASLMHQNNYLLIYSLILFIF